jgi:hypothetical protein
MQVRNRKRTWLGLILLAPWLAAGCGGPKLGQVEGVVLIDGKPVKDILVTFIPNSNENTVGPNSTAVTDENGHYQLVCDDSARRPGAVIGAHRVTLIDMDAVSIPSRAHGPPGGKPQAMSKAKGKAKPRVAARYMDWVATPLKEQVKPGSQTIDLKVAGVSGGN